MEKSPYDASTDDAFYRNQKRLKEELAQYQKNIELLDQLLGQADTSMEQIRDLPVEELKSIPKDKKPKRVLPKKNWLRI